MNETTSKTKILLMRITRSFQSIDNLFIYFGLILNGFSTIVSFVYGHIIAGIILLVCELLFIGIYATKLI